MKLYLIGLPSSGKTTLGKELASHLGLPFVDMDAEIERKAAMTIPQLFEKFGETKFRELEMETLHDLSQRDGLVIATGGGAPCFFDNMTMMNETGLTVFIDVDPAEIVRRLSVSEGTNGRPLLHGVKAEDLLNELSKKRDERITFYEQAKIHISDNNLSTEKLHMAIAVHIQHPKNDNP